MPVEKFYCGNCGCALYFGGRFKEHTLVQPCPQCQQLNPVYFHYCYRCGTKIILQEEDAAGETV
ncbi:MAG: hypothetical protein HY727_21075 [Candidatus Rokubacteria bacterium]|nr:hypothetical protein [Candidatus Rokubacteria bacterium]